ncbi:DUF6783 domain-containing protein [Fusicatenibacter saccharivorans]
MLKKVFRKMCVTIYGRFCPDEGIVAVLRVDRKSNIKKPSVQVCPDGCQA